MKRGILLKKHPKPYQKDCLSALRSAHEDGRALVVMASGLGKTLTTIFDVEEYMSSHPGMRFLALCHSGDILEQTREAFEEHFGSTHTYGMYNCHKKPEGRPDFLFANLQSVSRHCQDFDPDEFDYIMVDEAHHAPARTYRKAIDYFHPHFLLGLTATPDRSDDADITDIFGEPVYSYPLVEALRDQWLSPIRYRVIADEIAKLATLVDSEEKYSMTSLNRTIFVKKRDAEIARIIRREIGGKKDPTMVIFCQSIAHAEEFAQIYGDTVVIHSGMEKSERDARLSGFREGSIRTICAVDLLNEGIDVPRTDVIVFLRVTQSPVVFTQQLGRGLRTEESKNEVLVLDFVCTADRLQMIYRLKREFKETQPRYPRTRTASERDYLSISTNSSLFETREVDIVSLIERASIYRVEISNEEKLEALNNLYLTLGHVPTKREINNAIGVPSYPTYTNAFGSYENALALLGITDDRNFFYTDEYLIEALRDLYITLGHVPTKKEINASRTTPYTETYCRRFGNLTNSYALAGIETETRWHKTFATRQEMCEAIQKKAKILGRTPRLVDIKDDLDVPSYDTILKVFGSYGNLLQEARLRMNVDYREFSREELIALYLRKAQEVGGTPTIKEIDEDPSMPSYHTFIKVFGNFTNLSHEAGLPSIRYKAQKRRRAAK